jgi:hypothetical protein
MPMSSFAKSQARTMTKRKEEDDRKKEDDDEDESDGYSE